jgi:hypothetical protein
MSLDAVFAHTMDDAAARLAVARMHGAPSWQVLMERVEATPAIPPFAEDADTKRHAIDAIVAGDLEVLECIAAMHPELLRRAAYDNSGGSSLMWLALGQERRHGPEVVRPAMEWLASRGVDRARELGIRLCGHHGMTPREVHDLLELGADARWIADNGIPVLEHALLRYWNGDAVDVLAAHAPPLKALWIFAGLGDIEGVDSFLDHAGKPTIAARRLRPDFVAVGEQGYMPQLPEADDEELLLEALVAAMVNGRARMIDYLAARGAPVKSMAYGRPLIEVATNNRMTDVAQALARAGG